MRDIPKWPGKLEHRKRYPKENPNTRRRDTEGFEGNRN
jgi:hypothetical protein